MKDSHLDIDNETLVEQCKAGDRQALSFLYTRFASRMLRVINRYVDDRQDAQDILHDGFIVAFTRLKTLKDPEKLEFWLATIMKNLSLKFLQEQSVVSILDEIPDSEEDPAPESLIDFETLESLIVRLPEGYQKVFRLAVLEGKSHKEISRILGIAPNSSSSQLFHAKLKMRELIREHRLKAGLISLMLLLATSGLFISFHKPDEQRLLASSSAPSQISRPSEEKTETSADSLRQLAQSSPLTARRSVMKVPNQKASVGLPEYSSDVPISEEGSPTLKSSEEILPDTISPASDKYLAEVSVSDGYAEDIPFIPMAKKSYSDWSAGISFDSGVMMAMGGSDNDMFADGKDPFYGNSGSPDDSEKSPDEDSRRRARSIPDNLGGMSHRHHLPISFGVSAERRLASWFGVETGATYSYLHSDFESIQYTATCHWHYLELPLKANLYAYSAQRFSIYGSLSGRVALPVYCNVEMHPASDREGAYSESFSAKPVWSAGVSIGASYQLFPHVNLCLEPSLQYHFPTKVSIPNAWTDDRPWSLSIPVGIRFSW